MAGSPPGPPSGQGGSHEAEFRGISSHFWPAGLVPLFAVELESRVELETAPDKGAGKISRNHCSSRCRRRMNRRPAALRAMESSPQPARPGAGIACQWRSQWTERRPPPDWIRETDLLRLPHGGVWESNHLTLTVEYLNDRYAMVGDERVGFLRGTWRQIPEGDDGIWQAKRPTQTGRIPHPMTPWLFQWTRPQTEAVSILWKIGSAGEGWVREPGSCAGMEGNRHSEVSKEPGQNPGSTGGKFEFQQFNLFAGIQGIQQPRRHEGPITAPRRATSSLPMTAVRLASQREGTAGLLD